MIVDSLKNIDRYRGLSRGLDVLIDWLGSNDPAQLELGKNEIMGDKVYANVMEAKTKKPEDGRYEWHRRYIDVQMDLVNNEHIRVTPGEVVVQTEFDESKDAGFYHAAPGSTDIFEVSLEHNHFAVFMPGEPHMPNLVLPGAEVGPIKKICFKLLADEFWDEA